MIWRTSKVTGVVEQDDVRTVVRNLIVGVENRLAQAAGAAVAELRHQQGAEQRPVLQGFEPGPEKGPGPAAPRSALPFREPTPRRVEEGHR